MTQFSMAVVMEVVLFVFYCNILYYFMIYDVFVNRICVATRWR